MDGTSSKLPTDLIIISEHGVTKSFGAFDVVLDIPWHEGWDVPVFPEVQL